MNAVRFIRAGFTNCLVFSGRSTRPEYWWFFGFTLVGFYLLLTVDIAVLGLSVLGEPMKWLSLAGAFTLITLLPILAVGYRRLQDAGLPGWLYIALTAVSYVQLFASNVMLQYAAMAASVGTLVLAVLPSQGRDNQYGAKPQ
ncbi:hypothetical protein A8B78_06030 [Jannaschia sp. EhC01]|nr:hypothetical protein A8B78_06030 [Jannaschia sp. EhC01]